MRCVYAQKLEDAASIDPQHLGPRAAATMFDIRHQRISEHRKGKCVCTEPATKQPEQLLTGKVDRTPDGGEFIDVQTTEPVTDWADVFARFNLDPDLYEIIGDTVRMSTWQQSRRTDDGDRDIINLHSYRASFRRKVAGLVDFTSLRDTVRNWTPAVPAVLTPSAPPVTYVVGMADWQLGKGEGDGTEGTLKRLAQSLDNISRDLDVLEAQGIKPERILFANLGDHTENVAGSYASQTHTVDLNMRDQLNLALEINLQWIKQLAPRFKHATYAACLCNHGQLSRGQGRDNVTDDSDNATGLIGDTLRTICGLHDNLAHVDFHIPRNQMITTVTCSGVNIALAHGHKISGKEEDWLAKQSQHLTQAQRFIPDMWFTAHKHHADLKDYGPYTRIQATTVDPGSKYYLDMSGMYSRPGTTTFITGAHLPGKWDHYRIH